MLPPNPNKIQHVYQVFMYSILFKLIQYTVKINENQETAIAAISNPYRLWW